MSYLLLIVGFVVLTFSADFLVDGASGIARKFNISSLVIGLTVVAFGTSAPEMVVNLVASFKGTNEIAFTNILGSNIINVLVILGIASLFYPLAAKKSTVRIEAPMSLLAGLCVLLLGLDYIRIGNFDGLSRVDGVILLLFFLLFLYHTFRVAFKNRTPENEVEKVKQMKMGKAILLVIGGLAGLVLGGQIIVNSAVKIATSLGVSQSVIGATIVALGTSLPELATSVAAAIKKNADIAIGNVIGSNIFNIFLILGTSSLIHPVTSYSGLMRDTFFTILSSLLVVLFLLSSRRRSIVRWQGVLLLIVYGVYLYVLLG